MAARSDAKQERTSILLLVALCVLFTEKPAQAYIDPNATGLLAQSVTPVLILVTAGATFLRKQVSAAFRWMAGGFRLREDEQAK